MIEKTKQCIVEELQEYTGSSNDFKNLNIDDLLDHYFHNAILGNVAAETHIRLIKDDLSKIFKEMFPGEDVETYVSIASGPIRMMFKVLT